MMNNLSYPVGSLVSFVETDQSLAFIAKVDIAAAFVLILATQNDTSLLGFQRRDMDEFLTMECCSSCAILISFSAALEWIAILHSWGIFTV